MREFILYDGTIVKVDDEDFNHIADYQWYLNKKDGKIRAVVRNDNGRLFYMHREILAAPESAIVDHIDGNPLNNTKQNLRFVNDQQSNQNRGKFKNCSSKYKGVTWHKRVKRWQAQIGFNKDVIQLGYHETEELAAVHYDMAAIYLFGKYCRLNFPERAAEYMAQLE